ncbi:MAG: hypothetical protein H6704_27420 [Myxococcales bacterium]|nr:Rdx family protein [Myxococcales bacterium]MCB9539960.1 hypothetical protein [Myxococcales bacterium]
MAASITQATGEAVDLVSGGRGEFTVSVDGQAVAKKSVFGFPAEDEVVRDVAAALKGG